MHKNKYVNFIKRTSFQLVLLPSLLVSFFVFSTGALAQQQAGLTIEPAQSNFTISPIRSATGSFTISNNQPVAVNVQLDVYQIENESLSSITPSDRLVSITTQNNFVIQANQSVNVAYELNFDGSLADGFYQRAIVAGISSADQTAGNIRQLVPHQISFNLSQSGDISPQLNITRFQAGNPVLIFGESTFYIELVNQTPFSAKPILYFQLLSSSGDILLKEVLNSELRVLTNSKPFIFEVKFNDEMLSGQFGNISAQLLVVDTTSEIQLISEASFLYIPTLVIVIVILAIIVSITLLGINISKRSKKKALIKKRTSKFAKS